MLLDLSDDGIISMEPVVYALTVSPIDPVQIEEREPVGGIP